MARTLVCLQPGSPDEGRGAVPARASILASLGGAVARDHSPSMLGRQLALALALACSGLALPGCATTTVERVWEAPEFAGSFDRVVVFGLSKRPGVRRAFEEGVSEALRAKGVDAVPSYELFPTEAELTREQIATELAQRGIDGILAARLVAVDSRMRYVDGAPYVIAGGPPMGFYGYYNSMYGLVYSPSYMTEYDVVIIESNLYAAESAQLVWSGLSETFDPANVEDAVGSYGRAMTRTLVRAGLVRAE
jgi:hypothetical protein